MSFLISPPLIAVVLLSVSQSGLSEYVHGLSEPFSSLGYFGHLDFEQTKWFAKVHIHPFVFCVFCYR